MSTVSVPLTPKLESSLNDLVKSGFAETKAEVMRKALARLTEEEAVFAVLRAEQEIKNGKGLKGDLKTLLRKIK